MANDTLEEKVTFPCEPATNEELSHMLLGASGGGRDDFQKLRRMTVRISYAQIPWSFVQSLWVLGKADDYYIQSLSDAEMRPGIYINHDGHCLILIQTKESEIHKYITQCGNRLKELILCNTSLSELRIPFPGALEAFGAINNRKLSRISGLDEMTHLEELSLINCVTLLSFHGLWNMPHLKTLRLRGLHHRWLPGLADLTQLTTLSLSRLSNLDQLDGLEQLAQLTTLYIYGCDILTRLPVLDNLTQLTKLTLADCSILRELPSLDNLTQLTDLFIFNCQGLHKLPALNNLTQLTTLNISLCDSIRELPALDNLTQLTQLHLDWCGISELPPEIRSMKSLRRLDLRNLMLSDLPDWLPEIAEEFSLNSFADDKGKNKAIVYLDGTTVETIPDMSIFEQPYEVVTEWFEKRRLGQTHPLNEIKVVFLGDGEAGKSHTIARLMNDGGEPDYAIFDGQSTPGIVIRDKEYDLGDRKIRVHYWDFGGQEIMHSMHRIFLTGRTMYVILLNARDDTQGDRAKYWLHNVNSFAPDAPVLLVLNKIDQNENASVDETDLRGRYDKLTQVVRLSALKYSPEEFNDRFTKVLLEEIRKTGFLDAQWPISWTQVKEKLENMTSHYITGDDYLTICEACHVDQNQKELLHWFNDLGVSFCYDDVDDYALEDYVILRPDWITNALYIILFNRLESARNGLIPHRSIHNLLKEARNNPQIRCTLPKARYNAGDIQYVLGIMRKFNLSFTDGHENEFIPMLCQQNSTVDVQYYHRDADTLEFNMVFDYLPNNLLHRLMVERHAELDIHNVWRTGARFQFSELGYSAVVVIDGNILRFFIRHTDPMHRPNTYLTMLKTSVDRIVKKMGLTPPVCNLVYKLDGKRDVFDFEMLKLRLEVGQTHELAASHRKLIPIADILNQSAPDGLEDEKKLLDAIRRSCRNIQGEPIYYLNDSGQGMEDRRNRRLRDDLSGWGYNVLDQSQRGRSGSGKSIGELDLLLFNEKREPWTVIEALRVSNGSKTEWSKHLDKLIGNYNYFGAPFSYLLTYVDAAVSDFGRIWESYQTHIEGYAPDGFTCRGGSLVELNDDTAPQYVKTVKCQYDCGGLSVTVYHIFARIPTQSE